MSDRRQVELRRFDPSDEPSVLRLLQASSGWVPDDQHARFFRWKHVENPFGPSPAWVAIDPALPADHRVVGFRVFLRWEFEFDDRVVRAVRAVDTATHPDYQGRGIFTRLTLAALEALAEEGVSFVFNTPNERSRPGYLKMGWRPVGRLPVLARPRSPAGFLKMTRARTPADKWSVASRAGLPVEEVLADGPAVESLLSSAASGTRAVTTRRSVDYLRWRYGFSPLGYRAVVAANELAGGVVILRLRRRGQAVEAVVCEELAPPPVLGGLLRTALRQTGADHAVRLGGGGIARAGFVPVPRQGPTLVWRAVDEAAVMPDPSAWRLTMGDVELF